jgi:hypothetical protein
LICTICYTIFYNREALLNHEKVYHSDRKLPIINLPNPDKAFINFDITHETDLKKTVWYPFVFYADFEASTKVEDGKTIQVPNSYVIFSPDLMFLVDEQLSRQSFIKSFFSDDAELLMRQFVDDLRCLHKSHKYRIIANARVPRLTDEEEEKYRNAKVCENCGKEFGTRRDDGTKVMKIKHHDHVTNKFVGAWCSQCNTRNNYRYFKTIVEFHNFSGYDGHFIIKYATKFMHDDQPYSYKYQKIISKSSQKIKHFQYSDYIFVDSLNHLNSSLDKLLETLDKSNYCYPIFTHVGLHKILRSKGIYPYR